MSMLFSILIRLRMNIELSSLAKGLHTKCRDTTKPYKGSSVFRHFVDAHLVPWAVPYADYNPPDYTSDSVNGKPWADSPDPSSYEFNSNDSGIIRTSYHGDYDLEKDGRPLNPFGRTGLRGRGALGRWGPNHAADAIVSRIFNGKLQFVAIERHDTGELAIPGGMVDKGEKPFQTAIREFIEEAMGNRKMDELEDLWKSHEKIYTGYVDDPRNTDNSWMETYAVNFHDTAGLMDKIHLKGGDDAKSAQWVDVGGSKLYASHEYLIYLFAKAHEAKTEAKDKDTCT